MNTRWPIVVDMRWCPNCNVPVIGGKCSKCGGETIRLKLPPPGDARLALNSDIERINNVLKRQFDIDLTKIVKSTDNIVLAKEPYIDERRRIIVNGYNLGSMYYNPYLGIEQIKPSKLLTYILLHNKFIDYVVVHASKGESISLGREEDMLIGVNNKYVYVLSKINQGKYRVRDVYKLNEAAKEYEEFSRINNTKVTLNDVIKANSEKLLEYVSQSEAFIYSMVRKVSKPVILSFSGGKDSLTVLHLTLDTGVEPEIVFNNTGIELPETIETINKVIRKYGLKLNIANAGDSFWRAVKVYGPPARNYRWCCKVIKLVPFATLAKKTWVNGAVNILGQRAFESYDRARSPRVWRNRWVPHVLSIAPIQEWPQLLLWIYITQNKLTNLLNPLYYKGFERIGCYLCPASTLYEFKVVSETHPDLWIRWVKILKEHGCSDICIKLGLWRWLGPASTKKQLASKYNIGIDWKTEYQRYVRNKIIAYNKVNIGKRILHIVRFEKSLNIKGIEQQRSILGLRKKKDNVLINNKHVVVINNNTLIVSMPKDNFEYVIDVIKIAYRAMYCTQCRSCTLWCPTKAIKVNEAPVVDSNKCISCRLCLHECPLAELVVDKILSSLILNRYDGWRREGKTSKRKITNIIKIISGIVTGREEKPNIEKHHSLDYDVTIISNFDKY